MAYTNTMKWGDHILYRGYDSDGKRIEYKEAYRPSFFINAKNNTGYKTLHGNNVDLIQPGSIKDCKEFLKKYEGVHGFEIYGMNNIEFQHLSDTFPGVIQYDLSKIKIGYLDIEVESEANFADPENPTERINAITFQVNNVTYVFGLGKFDLSKFDKDDRHYVWYECVSEAELLEKFLETWTLSDIDAVSGWNCLPLNASVWANNKIVEIKKLKQDQTLFNSKVKNTSPTSVKKIYRQELANGARISSSKDHIFPYALCNSNLYTKISFGHKTNCIKQDMSVEDAMNNNDEKFVYVNLRNNTNENFEEITNDQCYLLGLIYTDGSIKNKSKLTNGFTLYQSDYSFICKIKEKFNIESKIVGPYKNCYHLHIPYSMIADLKLFIFNDLNEKEINKEMISMFSEEQYYHFLSGLLDGDGYHHQNKYSFCNFNKVDLYKVYELCLWNGIFTTITKNNLRIIDIKHNMLRLLKHSRWQSLNIKNNLKRNSSQLANKIKFRKDGNGYWVRVKNIIETNEYVEMMDIETDTHYFVSGGITTHNCDMYDIPYIVNRTERVLDSSYAKKLSPWGILKQRTATYFQNERQVYTIGGVSILDYQRLYTKYRLIPRESYKLDYIAEVELGSKKLDWKQDYSSMKDFYNSDFQKFIEYNIIDVDLVRQLDEKLNLIPLHISLSYLAKINYDDTFSPVRMWDAIIYNKLKENNIVIPLNPVFGEKDTQYAGAFVKDPEIGMHDWVVSFDLTSLYPSLICQYNISPETIIDRLQLPNNIKRKNISVDALLNKEVDTSDIQQYDICLAANGEYFKTNVDGFIPQLMKQLMESRSLSKNQMLKEKKEIEKIKHIMKERGIL